jgi:hypothetical protein
MFRLLRGRVCADHDGWLLPGSRPGPGGPNVRRCIHLQGRRGGCPPPHIIPTVRWDDAPSRLVAADPCDRSGGRLPAGMAIPPLPTELSVGPSSPCVARLRSHSEEHVEQAHACRCSSAAWERSSARVRLRNVDLLWDNADPLWARQLVRVATEARHDRAPTVIHRPARRGRSARLERRGPACLR